MTKSSQKRGQNCIPFLEYTYPEIQRKNIRLPERPTRLEKNSHGNYCLFV